MGLYYIATNGLFLPCYILQSVFGYFFDMFLFPLFHGNLFPNVSLFRPLFFIWKNTAVRVGNFVPEKFRLPVAALLVIVIIVVGTFASPVSKDNNYQNRGISIAGLVTFYAVLYGTSANRKKIVWRTVLVGLLCQYVLALFVLRTKTGYDIFNFISFLARYEHLGQC